MKAAPFAYARPSSLEAAIRLMADAKGAVKVIAGGQSLGPMLNLRLVQPDLIVDISALTELKQTGIDGDALVVGACVTHGDIEDGRIPDVTGGAMREVARNIAYRAVRNRGTIGGSLSHADPAADWVSVLPALGARVRLCGTSGSRELPVEDFMTGALESALRPDELVASVLVPKRRPSARWGYAKACRKPGEFAHAIAAVLIDPQNASSRIVIGAIEAPPVVLRDASPLFGGRVSSNFVRDFDAKAAEALLLKAGVTDAVDRHIHIAVLRRAIDEAAA